LLQGLTLMTPTSPIAQRAALLSAPASLPRIDDGMTLSVAGRRFGLTLRAIRHYEQQGLVRPLRDSKGRRVFDGVQGARLELIAVLRAADVPLQEIARVLAAPDPQQSRAMALTILERRLRQIQASHARAAAALEQFRTSGGSLTGSLLRPMI
ncbi:MAG TPA: MerR family transcriptional regulator, partial [Caulobacter sp.]|nr:MerR family transcriptional regulator [Caulobacter sp.]